MTTLDRVFPEPSVPSPKVSAPSQESGDEPIVPDIPLQFPRWPQYGQEERRGLLQVLEQDGWWRMSGHQVDRFEHEFADHHGAPYALTTNSGTAALELALSVLGVGPGSEVILPAFTFISCSLAVQRLGAVPVPVDVNPDTYCLDIDRAAAAVTANTKVIMPVHMAGQCVDMDALQALADASGVAILQDAAHAHGARWKGRRIGEFGSIAAFSFQNGKLMTAGEGGALLFPDKDTYRQAYLQHSCGRPAVDRDYKHLTGGSNNRMSEFHGAVLRGQLSRLEAQIQLRKLGWGRLRTALRGIPGVHPQKTDSQVDQNSLYMAMIRVPGIVTATRRAIVDELNRRGVPAFVAFPPVYRTDSYWEGPTGGQTLATLRDSCPVSEQVGQDCIWFHHRTLLAAEPVLDRMAEVVAETLPVAS